jgi:hypothetical protein
MFTIPRNTQNVQFNIDMLNKLKVPFEVQHGTYTTSIITEHGKSKYFLNTYNTRVFRCAKMIKKDVENSPYAPAILDSKFFKTNYGLSDIKKSYFAQKVLNIDISSAYATCLFNKGLITQDTFNVLKTIPKAERLPCVGMLATSHSKFYYDDGKCVNVDMFRSPTANIFFYLIDEINYIMKNIEFMLGKKFIFYWVDGIFFDANTDKKTIQNIENYLTDLGYKYKYEDVQDFKMNVDERKLSLRMIKNGDIKVYTVGKDNVGESIKKYINDQIKKQDQTPTINKI